MNEVATLAKHIDAADRVVVFTGAGISTESGIPDFRSPGGVWSKIQPIYFQDFVADREARREGWRRVFERTAGWVGAAPNAGHHAIAKLVDMGKVTSVITQNVDNLHQDGGVPDEKVIEVHGNASYAKCLNCGKRHDYETLRPRWEADEDITCDFCGGLVKSATISFGQAMPEDKMMFAESEAVSCDLMIAIGSSLVVYPAANIPLIAKQNGAKYIIINREETEHDVYADLVIHTEIGPLLRETMTELGSPL
ncbi:MAG: NAD-dependent deacetylase [Henriciella sp.]|nr:NAD-dependent deacetylase [Henriciella sp.]